MRSFYISRRQWKLALTYLFTLALMAGSAWLFLSEPETAPTLGEAYRSGTLESNKISLTINVDWGEEYIPDLLSVLSAYQVPATFFLTGRWADNHPDLTGEIAAAGHEIGNHGYSHSSPNASSIEEIQTEITRTEQAIYQATGTVTRLYAPPSGECEEHVVQAAEQAGYFTILWSVDTIDWQKPDPETILQRVRTKIHGGAIILAHPTASTVEALGSMIEELEAEGYEFVTVSENLGI